MKIQELYELYGITKDDFRFFYDTKINKIVPIHREYFELMEQGKLEDSTKYSKDSQNEVEILHYYESHPKELVFFPTVDMYDLINAKAVFIRELKADVRKEFEGYSDSKEDIESFLSKVEELKLIGHWDRCYVEQIEQRVNDWVHANEIKGVYNATFRNKPLKTLKKIAKLKPWKVFKKKALVRVHVGTVDFYINFISEKKNFKGLVIYPGESGLNDYEMITNVSVDNGEAPLINMALQNSILCSFRDYENLSVDERRIIDNSKLKFYKNNYPSIKLFKEGYYPTLDVDEESMHLISSVLEILYNGILECINQDYIATKLQANEYLQIDLDQNDLVSIEPWAYVPSETINNYGLDITPRKATCFLDDTLNYEVKVDVISSPLSDGFDKFYVFSLFVIDLDNGQVVYNAQSFYDGEVQALAQLSKLLHDFAEENDFATNVTVSDFLSEMLVVSAIGDDVEIDYEYMSSYMEEVFNQLNALTDSLDDKFDNDEVDLKTLN